MCNPSANNAKYVVSFINTEGLKQRASIVFAWE